jgi:hypothetical protein
MPGPRTLFLQHEQRLWYWEEPGHLELYLPMLHSGLLGEVRTHPYQRDIRWLRQRTRRNRIEAITRQRAWRLFLSTLRRPDSTGSGDPEDIDQEVTAGLAASLGAVIDEFRPDLVVYAQTWHTESLPRAVLEPLKDRFGFKLFSVIWDYDDNNPLLIQSDGEVIAMSDLVAIADSSLRTDRIRRRDPPYAAFTNVEAVRFMPMAADPAIFRPSPHRRHDVTIAGSSEGQRIAVYYALSRAGLNVNRAGGLMPGDAYLSHPDYARALAESRIVVNTQTRGERVQLKGRVAQTLASGALLLEQFSVESARFLATLDLSQLLWHGTEDLIEKIHYWLAHEAEREALAALSRERYLQAHGPRRWTATVLSELGLGDPGVGDPGVGDPGPADASALAPEPA